MELLQPRQTESHENETTHAVDSVSILVHEGGRRIFVNDCPLEFFESKGTCGVAAARPLNSLLDMHVVAAGVFQVKAASGPVLNQQFSGHGVSGSSMPTSRRRTITPPFTGSCVSRVPPFRATICGLQHSSCNIRFLCARDTHFDALPRLTCV